MGRIEIEKRVAILHSSCSILSYFVAVAAPGVGVVAAAAGGESDWHYGET